MKLPDARLRAWLWSILVVAALGLAGGQLHRGVRLSTNILDLLPPGEQNPVVAAAVTSSADRFVRQELFVFGAESFDDASAAAALVADRLDRSGAYERVAFRLGNDSLGQSYDLYFPYRYQLLTPADRDQLGRPGGPEAFLRQRLRTVYSPLGGGVTRLLDRDPLLLFPGFVQALPRPAGNAQLRDGVITATDGSRHYAMVVAVSTANPFARTAQEQLDQVVEPALAEVATRFPGVECLQTGVLPFAVHAGRTAQREATVIGVGSVAGIVLLMLAVFRSLRHLLASLLPIGIGLIVAFAVSHWLFGGLHLITLAFGASMVGICIDYTLHWYADQLTGGNGWTPALGLRHVFPGITLGMVTSVMAYLGLCVAPFPGLRQMAVFSMLGLIAAYLTVVCWFPRLFRRPRPAPRRSRLLALAAGYLAVVDHLRRCRWRWPAAGAAVLVAAAGLGRLTADDDVRSLRNAPPALLAQADRIRELIRGPDEGRFFVIEGATEAEVLARDERLAERLALLVSAGRLGGFVGLSRFVPSPSRQRADHDLLHQAFLAGDDRLDGYLAQLGLKDADAKAVRDQLAGPVGTVLTADTWAASPLADALPMLWLGPVDGDTRAAVCLVSGITDEASLRAAADQLDGVHYVNRLDDMSYLFRRYRHLASLLVGLAYAAILLLLVWRYGWRRGASVLVPPLLSAGLTLAILGLLGQPLNLFALMALLLVLGIGVDYGIFLSEAASRPDSTMLAIILSALTTLLSFGLLSLSETPVLRCFGLAIVIGIGLSLLTAPLATEKAAL